jgi:hypothetical protein
MVVGEPYIAAAAAAKPDECKFTTKSHALLDPRSAVRVLVRGARGTTLQLYLEAGL